jgi:Bacterial Ig-like domain (group 1)
VSANPNIVLTPKQEAYAEHSVASIATKITIANGNNQSGAPGTQLAQALTVIVADQYGNPFAGNSVIFSDNGAGGTFSNGSTVVTGANGVASELYTLPQSGSTVTIDATATGISSPAVFTETSVAGVATKIAVTGGNNQSGTVGTQLPQSLTVLVTDQNGNPLSGNSVTFSDNGAGGTFSNGSTVVTGANGTASQSYTLPKGAANITINATAAGVSAPAVFSETAVAGTAASITIVSGNNQTAPNGTQLPHALVVVVADKYGNPVSGVSVSFSDGGSGGIFSNPNPGTTGSNGTVSQMYTLPPVGSETVVITATAAGVNNPAVFTENGQ